MNLATYVKVQITKLHVTLVSSCPQKAFTCNWLNYTLSVPIKQQDFTCIFEKTESIIYRFGGESHPNFPKRYSSNRAAIHTPTQQNAITVIPTTLYLQQGWLAWEFRIININKGCKNKYRKEKKQASFFVLCISFSFLVLLPHAKEMQKLTLSCRFTTNLTLCSDAPFIIMQKLRVPCNKGPPGEPCSL